jgi:transcriptional regulator with XRE-family HTH domain
MKRTYLREWRKAAGKTLEQVAEEIGITHQQLGKIERGLQPYNQHLLEQLTLIYGCDEVDLLARPPGQAQGVMETWRHIPEEARPQALAVLQAFAKAGAGG